MKDSGLTVSRVGGAAQLASQAETAFVQADHGTKLAQAN